MSGSFHEEPVDGIDHCSPLAVTPAGRVTPGTILLVAVWIGMIAGFIDVGLLVLNRKWIEEISSGPGDTSPGSLPWP